ncbi:MAG TPA: glycosyltransferase family 2 protein, partial [Acidimicrobiia bacterium]|nr:glycosyltransferase family 2 protein [Acidimicrobiia bacterium]
RRRQIGADRRSQPNPVVPAPATARSLAMGRLALTVTCVSWLAYMITVTGRQLVFPSAFTVRGVVETVVYAAIVTLLTLSAVAYLITRQGYLRRTRSHARTPRAEIEAFFGDRTPSVTVLIPSYRERSDVILQTMLSAALQDLPRLRVVLLVDDPPASDDPDHRRLLAAARAVPAQILGMLEQPRRRFTASLEVAETRVRAGHKPTAEDLLGLVADYEHAAAWLQDLAANWVRHDHTDDFFVDHLLLALANDLSVVAAAVNGAVLCRSLVSADRLLQLHRRLAWTFTAELTSFERKQYLSLSAEANKAMNLNGYIGLMGGSYCEQRTSAGSLLLPCEANDPDASLHVPAADYIVTLDADSLLLPDYGLRLVYLMEQPENERVGVVQSPYSAYPGAPTRVERIAGATTDLQYIVHQGMAEHHAAFWVGANAVLRAPAVEALRIDDGSEGHLISRFISDRTVIEDTESTLDLVANGWTVMNYPERLAYSATPPDFGSLCIQRQRWSNGGLIILAKLRSYWRTKKERGETRRPVELLLRLNYLASISWATVGLILLLAYPFSGRLMSGLVLLTSAPYFLVMASDLKRCGYKHTDV